MCVSDLIDAYRLLNLYYGRELSGKVEPDWDTVASLGKTELAAKYPAIAAAMDEVVAASSEDREDFKYEFNRLFVGPEKLPAAPYETVYLSPERTLMRQHTLSVREAYLNAGLVVDKKNVEPDDHFAYECAFAAYLLEQIEAENDGEGKGLSASEARKALAAFTKEHLSRWAPLHAEAVESNTDSALCKGFAHLMAAVVEATADMFPPAETQEAVDA